MNAPSQQPDCSASARPCGGAASSAACADCVLELLGEDARAELAALARVHTGGNAPQMAALLLVRQLRPLEFEMSAA